MLAAVEISESIQQGIDDLVGFLPRLIGFLLILLVGYLVAKALQKVVALALEKVGTDRALASGTSGTYVERVIPDLSPSEVIGRVVFWFVLLGALSIAITSLGINALNDFLADVFSYLPNVVAAILIFVIAAAVAGWLGHAVSRLLGDSPYGPARGHRTARARDGHRHLHDPEPASDRARHRHHHLCGADGSRGSRNGARVRARWARSRVAHPRRRLPARPGRTVPARDDAGAVST